MTDCTFPRCGCSEREQCRPEDALKASLARAEAAERQRDEAIAASDARAEAMREALRPFAELGGAWLAADEHDNSIWVTSPDSTPVNNLTNFGFTFGHFRAAARALLAKGEK